MLKTPTFKIIVRSKDFVNILGFFFIYAFCPTPSFNLYSHCKFDEFKQQFGYRLSLLTKASKYTPFSLNMCPKELFFLNMFYGLFQIIFCKTF